ncbi:MAG: 6-phosphogluconolactonase [Rhodobacteraceae bacterium]|jgi:6-phosphogluconolactonase|uniref:6-phosphogluconolactonase n=1 Tax=Albidovulum sp. TaxID=1872424 RepID=UPI001D4076B3|nr:6-phosphogluconolactonase [uncultured Defluviimonas sp.]MCB2117007.1 6-phosphogluconolactonase [Paracoccaceae bacterium]MCC0068685.1 6-phosphogluconolactonase [Paracoccaceae bacterium]
MEIVEYPDRELMMIALADRLASELATAVRGKGSVSFCVPGGTTPGPVFDTLSGISIDWDRVTVFLNDERWVPESHERSNARLVRQRLLTGRAAAAAFVPLYADTPEPEQALDALTEALSPHLPIDVLLLGMGADLHTASLFPGADRLAEALAPDAPVLMALRAPGAGEPRVTLTARVLADAMACHILITGAEKRAALDRARGLPAEDAPVNAVLTNATVHWAE